MELIERFLEYTKFDTQSSEDSNTVPSTDKQLVFADYLKKELVREGFDDVYLDDKGYLYATLKANSKHSNAPTIGFISHYDTSPDCSGANVKAHIVKNYDGSDILLSEGIISSPKRFPELLNHIGEDLIVTDGTTLLGADDKAGIAEIMNAVEYLVQHPEVKHGRVRVAFTPDEEIGQGPHHFDVAKFGADWAYTMDGGEIGELEYENFNAAAAKVIIRGCNVHPGYAKNKMLNSMRVAQQFVAMLPPTETPEHTEGYEGFYHLVGMNGTVEQSTLTYIIRDHNRERFEQRKAEMNYLAQQLDAEYGAGTVTVELRDQYYNMREKIEPVMHVVELACKAMEQAGVKPKITPIRGGTDGAQLSFMGLPCPNIFAGGHNFHGRYEFVPIQSMQKATEVILNIITMC